MREADLTAGETPAWDALARNAANVRIQDDHFDDIWQLLAFELNGAPYAVPVERVREIVRLRPITPVPRFPDDVRGVISLRGEIIQVVNLYRRLGIEPVAPTRRTRIIVVTTGTGDAAGIIVDSVRSVMRVSRESIRPAAGSESGAIESLCAYEDEFVSVVDLNEVLSIDG